MKRSPMRRSLPPKFERPDRSDEFASFVPMARRSVMSVVSALDPVPEPIKKFAYVRDERLRDMCRAMACQHCGLSGPDAGVTWAHSNQGEHGHGRGVKASDVYVAAMCWRCHRELDQGKAWTQEKKVSIWNDAHLLTLRTALRLGLWPPGVPVPATLDCHDLEPTES